MRQAIVNGNECSCDRCGMMLYSADAVKVKFSKLDLKQDNTGRYAQFLKYDLCCDCLEDLKEWMEE